MKARRWGNHPSHLLIQLMEAGGYMPPPKVIRATGRRPITVVLDERGVYKETIWEKLSRGRSHVAQWLKRLYGSRP
jgi:hypothetical protein